MAEAEIEELLDFDGSDYEFGLDEGLSEEEDVDYRVVEECGTGLGQAERTGTADPPEQGRNIDFQQISEAAEARKEADRTSEKSGRISESRNVKHSSKADLEDGELFDMTAMVNSKKQTEHGVVKDVKPSRKQHSDETMDLYVWAWQCGKQRDSADRDAERNADNRQDRKRRKGHDYERHQYSSRNRKESYERYMGRYDRSQGGRYDRFGGFPDPRTRGPQFFYPNYSPGIMGPGRPDIRASTAGLEIFSPAQLQELLNQEHILRNQQMLHLARLGIRPSAGQPMYPMMNPNFFRPPLQPMGSDMSSRLGFMGSMGPLGVQGHRFPPAGRGPGVLGGTLGVSKTSKAETAAASGPGRVAHGRLTTASTEAGTRTVRSGQLAKQDQDSPRKNDRDLERESISRKTGNTLAATTERDSREKSSKGGDNTGNLIHLGGPVQKSRVLTVSGLLENTPMSAVADAFEKQGKILDFRKNQAGDVFTITFSSVQEALSAKRHLHRSMLAGRQITVEYAGL